MSVLTPEIGSSVAARINPVTKLCVALLIAFTLVLSIDAVSAGIVAAFVLILLPWSGLNARQFWLRTSPIWISAVLAAITTTLYGVDSGGLLATLGPITVTEGSVTLAGAIGLRVLAIGIPGIVLFITTDPTELADGLAQSLRLPARFVLGALAGLRLVGLLIDDWRALELARRARGVADRGAARRFLGQAFSLLVLAIRRGSKLATAMEARGFGADVPRTWARPSRFALRDAMLAAIAVVAVATAVTTSVLLGAWNPVLG